ncbi:MAG: amidohydrolase family protein [Planctomycetes bacterium]|nr:amidohydrolase family protein [Planctomycetota bacterium]
MLETLRGARIPRSGATVLSLALLLGGADLVAQRRGAPPQPLALRVGTIHPVSGPAITDGVILIRGGRIAAVGPAGEIELPEDARVLEYPSGHAYPGFVDALSSAFADAQVLQAGGVDASSTVDGALDPTDVISRQLAACGVTTAYVSSRATAPWRGRGVLIRPQPDGFRAFGRGETPVAEHWRLVVQDAHPLAQVDAIANSGKEFDELAKYEEAFEKHAEKVKEYDEAFEKYLAWHRARKPASEPGSDQKDGAQPPGEAPAPAAQGGPEGGGTGGPPGEGGRRPGGRRRPPESGGGETPAPAGGQPPQSPPAEAPKPDGQQPAGESKDEAPKRPDYPKAPARDPAKDALIEVRDGKLKLFAEARRPAEIRRVIEIVRELKLSGAVLEDPTGGAELAADIARAGLGAILTTGLPPGDSPFVAADQADLSVAAAFARAGVPFALASGDAKRARQLADVAAEAIGEGVPEDVALRAITLTPAELLGVADRVGSLAPERLADVVITSGPLFASDSRIVSVLSGGREVRTAESDR